MSKRLIKKKSNATWQQKYNEMVGRCRELQKRVQSHDKAIEQTRMLVDGLLIRAVVAYGKDNVMELPDTKIEDTLNEYSLQTAKEGEKLVLRVIKNDSR